jgi:hypothetical protein
LLGPGSVQSEDLDVSEEMHLTLISVEPGAFDISENDKSQSGIQTILPGYGANWQVKKSTLGRPADAI